MARITITKLSKVYPDDTLAVADLTLTVANGEFLVLVGPSGCGKSTVLRCVAGLETPTSGSITLDGRVITHLPPADRNLAMVFQTYALYPHLSVFDNLAFGLKMRGYPREEIRLRVLAAAAKLGISGHLKKKPRELSGGERQRVALGRAIVRQPQAFLMDEPLSNLDAALRVRMRAELLKLQRDLGVTVLYVTHDQIEALTMGGRVAVLHRGRLQQVASPQELYARPANRFVAGFIGSPAMNFLTGRLRWREGRLILELAGQTLDLPGAFLAERPGLASCLDRPLIVGFRPEHLAAAPGAPEEVGRGRLKIEVEVVETLGPLNYVHSSLPDPLGPEAQPVSVTAALDPAIPAAPGQVLWLAVNPGRLHFFDQETGRALSPPPAGPPG